MDLNHCRWCRGDIVPVVSLEDDQMVVDYACVKCGRINSLTPLIIKKKKPQSNLVEVSTL